MDTTLGVSYCLLEDMLQSCRHQEPPQRRVRDAEVITTAPVCFFGGNFATARSALREKGYVPRMLSKRQFNRRLHRLSGRFKQFFELLGEVWKQREEEQL